MKKAHVQFELKLLFFDLLTDFVMAGPTFVLKQISPSQPT